VKFRPGGFSGFLGRPLHEITDRAVPLHGVFGADGDALVRDAAARDEPTAKIALAEAFLRERMPPPDPEVELVQQVVIDMLTVDPGTTVQQIAERHAVSTRTLQRLFRRHVGVGPKWVLRRYRLQEAAEQLAAGERSDWTRLALDLGYFDHAHFIRDFRAVVGRRRLDAGDFVYLDPPYVPISKTASFTGYAGGFSMADQERLARLLHPLAGKGVPAVLSNSDCEDTRRLYDGLVIESLPARRAINSVASRKRPVAELLVQTRASSDPAGGACYGAAP